MFFVKTGQYLWLREGEGTYNVIATMEEFITERPKGGESKNIY